MERASLPGCKRVGSSSKANYRVCREDRTGDGLTNSQTHGPRTSDDGRWEYFDVSKFGRSGMPPHAYPRSNPSKMLRPRLETLMYKVQGPRSEALRRWRVAEVSSGEYKVM